MSTLMSYCGSVNLGQPSLRGERKRGEIGRGGEEKGEEKGEERKGGKGDQVRGWEEKGEEEAERKEGRGTGARGWEEERRRERERRWKYFQTLKTLSFTLAHLGKTVIHSGNVEVSFNASYSCCRLMEEKGQ